MAENVRFELTNPFQNQTAFKAAPLSKTVDFPIILTMYYHKVDIANLAVGEGLEPSCPFQDYSLAGCRFYHSPTLLLTLVLSNGIEPSLPG